MFVGIYQSIAILSIAVVFYVADFWLIRRFDKLRTRGSSRSWSYTLFAVVVALVIVGQPVWWPWLGWATTANWGLALQLVGIVVVLLGLGLHWWARVNLGQFYSEREELQPGQFLIYRGPYIHIRHPIYTSYFLLVIGLVLIVPALTTLLTALYAFYDFYTAAVREERLMTGQLAGYDEFLARTPRFFPRLFGSRNK
jgi:protein-S-isoprenylcysteine O-methyltransferase Ste14